MNVLIKLVKILNLMINHFFLLNRLNEICSSASIGIFNTRKLSYYCGKLIEES